MNLVIKGKELQLYFSKEQLNHMVVKIANQISADYQERHPIFIGVLNGAFMFMADLIRAVDPQLKFQIDFIKLSSYEGKESTGIVKALSGLKNDIKGRHVIIIEDIIETGLTITAVIEEMKKLEPASVKLCACFLKTGKQKQISSLIIYAQKQKISLLLVMDQIGMNMEEDWINYIIYNEQYLVKSSNQIISHLKLIFNLN